MIITPVILDNISEKKWYCVLSHKEFGNVDGLGTPFKILAVNLPYCSFINVYGQAGIVDLRKWELVQTSRKYINSFKPSRKTASKSITAKLEKCTETINKIFSPNRQISQ